MCVVSLSGKRFPRTPLDLPDGVPVHGLDGVDDVEIEFGDFWHSSPAFRLQSVSVLWRSPPSYDVHAHQACPMSKLDILTPFRAITTRC